MINHQQHSGLQCQIWQINETYELVDGSDFKQYALGAFL
jgi:hypothetical protein